MLTSHKEMNIDEILVPETEERPAKKMMTSGTVFAEIGASGPAFDG